jgi:hypothetical protein
MRSVMHSMLVAAIVLGFFASADKSAQAPIPGAETVLEVIATRTTMASETKYVYLNVFSDGTAEYQSSRINPSGKEEFLTFKKTLTQDEFIRITLALSEPKVGALRPRYETRYAIVDTWTEWALNIHHEGKLQVIHVLEFSPGLAKEMKHPYPTALVTLGCNIQKLRADVSGEPSFLDSECVTVLASTSKSKF